MKVFGPSANPSSSSTTMVWVVEEHLNCSTRPAAWTLCTFDVINGSVLAGMGAVGVVLNLLVLYILLVARVKIGGKQASYNQLKD